jgi:hypothetical protein
MKANTLLLITLIIFSFDILGAPVVLVEKSTLHMDFKDELVIEAGSVTEIDRSAIFKNIAITSDNHLVIATWQDAFLLKKDGGPLKRIGGKVPGEGYYDGVICLYIDSSDNIYLMDNYNVHIFDKLGVFKKKIPILPKVSHYLPCFYISPSGDIFAFFDYVQKNSIKLVLEHRNNNGKKIADIYYFNNNNVHILSKTMTYVSSHSYMEDCYMVPILKKEICFASNLEYRLYFYDPENKKQRSVTIEEKPMGIGNDELIAFKNLYKSQYEKLIFPPHRPFFQGLLSDEKGRIYAIRTKPVKDVDKNGRTLDVFDKHGNFLFHCYIPCTPMLIDRGRIFYVSKIKGKPSQLRVLRINNYEEIPY